MRSLLRALFVAGLLCGLLAAGLWGVSARGEPKLTSSAPGQGATVTSPVNSPVANPTSAPTSPIPPIVLDLLGVLVVAAAVIIGFSLGGRRWRPAAKSGPRR